MTQGRPASLSHQMASRGPKGKARSLGAERSPWLLAKRPREALYLVARRGPAPAGPRWGELRPPRLESAAVPRPLPPPRLIWLELPSYWGGGVISQMRKAILIADSLTADVKVYITLHVHISASLDFGESGFWVSSNGHRSSSAPRRKRKGTFPGNGLSTAATRSKTPRSASFASRGSQ